ncbi:hypothetical protein [Streptomyces sp. NRRL F-4489]|uniref:hypothetical protein n=1 Tax=Streptomyces sp. NRRL F-4489 TaxID=1609095 RepID=UPI000B27AD0F|nr:hypothetical protein [Streptomyces sp. NRRL F-4489]
MTIKLCRYCDDETPAVARVFFAWTHRDGRREEAEKDLCAIHLGSKRAEFTEGGEGGPTDPAFEVQEEYEAALDAVASGQWDRTLTYIRPNGIKFVWHRGLYIDVFMAPGDQTAVTALGCSLVEKSTYEEFKRACDEWWDGLDGHDRQAYRSEAFWQNRDNRD